MSLCWDWWLRLCIVKHAPILNMARNHNNTCCAVCELLIVDRICEGNQRYTNPKLPASMTRIGKAGTIEILSQ